MKAEVILCDRCKQKVSKQKCCICELDICENCGNSFSIKYGYNQQEFVKIEMCNDCDGEITKILKDKKHDIEKIKEIMIRYIKDNIVLKELQNETEISKVTG